ncbi:hypothetical protein IJ182_04115 [bacterium]|nr:hypothetical protein [bacterium]
MKGCLGIIIKTVIAVLVFFGLVHLGAVDFIKDKISEHQSAQEQQEQEEKDIVDLSEINDEYTIDKDLKILKNRMIIAEHNATGQKMIMVEPRNEDILTQEDINADNIQQKIDDIINKYKYQVVKFDRVEVTKHGEFKGLNQTIPYVKINAEISNLPIKGYEGILGVAKLDNGKNLIIVSVNQNGKYSQIINNAFYEKVK